MFCESCPSSGTLEQEGATYGPQRAIFKLQKSLFDWNPIREPQIKMQCGPRTKIVANPCPRVCLGPRSSCEHGRQQTFFQGRAKIFQGGQEPTFCLKTKKKILFFPKKSKTYYYKSPPCPPLRTPMVVNDLWGIPEHVGQCFDLLVVQSGTVELHLQFVVMRKMAQDWKMTEVRRLLRLLKLWRHQIHFISVVPNQG